MAATNETTEVSVEEQVKEVIAERLGMPRERIELSARFVEDLGADSLDVVELVMAMEDKFEIEIPDDQSENIKTVQDAVKFVVAHGH